MEAILNIMTENSWGGPRPVTRPDDKRLGGEGGQREGAGRPATGVRFELGQKVYVRSRWNDKVMTVKVVGVTSHSLVLLEEETGIAINLEIA